MDTSVTLVQAYLHVNGYFTVAEYPVLEAYRGDHARTVTDLVQQLLARGHVVAPTGHSIRMVAFGDVQANHPEPAWTTVPMRHVVQFLQSYLRTHWNVLRHAQIRDPAFGVLALIEKWGVDAERGAPVEKPDVRRAHGDVRVHGKS